MTTSNNDNESLKTLLVTYTITNDLDNLILLINDKKNIIDLNELITWDSENECIIENFEVREKYNIESPIYYTTLLNLASIKGHVEIVEFLLEHGALPTIKDGRGRTPFICCIYGSLDTLLVTPENYSKIVQITDNHLKIAKIYLKWLRNNDIDNFDIVVNLPQNNTGLRGITPLCLASYLGKTKLVKLLIEEGADVNGQDKNGATALMYAGKYLK
ncbi:ankyrin [Piromyces finnis]|uniref:Ankyrin n=1 Tax=Piromyces finnis TaxID=1754191 RepID=A0A1Y1VM61_9FUNG|nr:ankyrin [Piromyces finnis]|eukprot:ORX59859.1 ankyrin [Piromyces finnis]